MDVHAKARYLRLSPRKARLIVDVIRGLSVPAALTQLQFLNKGAALPVLKLLKSAVANAEHNFHLEADDLVVKSIVADGGPILHRWAPRAMGRSAPIRKRTTHVTIVLAPNASMPKKTVKKSRTGKRVSVKKT